MIAADVSKPFRVELAWIGFQPLEAVFGVVGLIVVALAWRLSRADPT